MLNYLYRLLLLGLLTGACTPQPGELPARVSVNQKFGVLHFLVVPDDTTDLQLENLLFAFSRRSPVIKEKYGLEPDLLSFFVFRERDRAGADLDTWNEMGMGSTPLDQRRSYFRKIAARYSRKLEGTEIATIGDIKVEHRVVILNGPAAKESYELLRQQKIPPND